MKKPTQTDYLKYVIRDAILEGVRKTLIFAAYSFQWIDLKKYIKSICKGLSVKVVILRNYINKPEKSRNKRTTLEFGGFRNRMEEI
jgi:hypothetical protein